MPAASGQCSGSKEPGFVEPVGEIFITVQYRPLLQVIALYKEGHDGLGEEVLSSVGDKGSLGVRLLHVAVLRLTKGPCLYDVRTGWGRGVPKKQTKGTRLRELCM